MKRVGTVEDIPILVDAVKALIEISYRQSELIRHMDRRLALLGEPSQLSYHYVSAALAQEFGVVPPTDLVSLDDIP